MWGWVSYDCSLNLNLLPFSLSPLFAVRSSNSSSTLHLHRIRLRLFTTQPELHQIIFFSIPARTSRHSQTSFCNSYCYREVDYDCVLQWPMDKSMTFHGPSCVHDALRLNLSLTLFPQRICKRSSDSSLPILSYLSPRLRPYAVRLLAFGSGGLNLPTRILLRTLPKPLALFFALSRSKLRPTS